MYLIEFSAKSCRDIDVVNVAYVGRLPYPASLSVPKPPAKPPFKIIS